MTEGTAITNPPDPVPTDGDLVLEQTPRAPVAPGAPGAPGEGDQPKPGPAAPKAPELAKTVEELQRQLNEQSGTLKFIGENFEKLLNRQSAPAAPAAAPEPKEPTPQELIDDISQNGLQGLRKHGLLTRKEVEKMRDDLRAELRTEISSTVNGTVRDATLGQQYPDLLVDTSEFRKEVAVEFDKLMRRAGPNADRHGMLETAAELVTARHPKTTTRTTPTREERIAAQADHGTDGDDDLVSVDTSYNNSALLGLPEAKRYGVTPEKLQAETRRMKKGR